jgi:hypothetical protein
MRLETQTLHLFLCTDEERHRRLGHSFMRLEMQTLQLFLHTAGDDEDNPSLTPCSRSWCRHSRLSSAPTRKQTSLSDRRSEPEFVFARMLVAWWVLSAASSVGIRDIHIRALRPQALNLSVDGNRGARTEVLQMHQVHYVCSVQVSMSMCCFIPASPWTDGKSWGACYRAEATPPIFLISHATRSTYSGVYCCRASCTRKSSRADLVAVVGCSCEYAYLRGSRCRIGHLIWTFRPSYVLDRTIFCLADLGRTIW